MRPHKVKFKITLLCAALLGLAIYLFSGPATGFKHPPLQSGDIVFRKENSLWGDIASSIARRDGKYSHAGIVQILPNGTIEIIHAYANTNKRQAVVAREPLDEFLGNATAYGFYRLNFTPPIRADVAARAAAYYNAHTPFDEQFSIADDKALYCTELVWRSAKNASGYDIAPTKSSIMGKVFIGADDLFLGGFMQEVRD